MPLTAVVLAAMVAAAPAPARVEYRFDPLSAALIEHPPLTTIEGEGAKLVEIHATTEHSQAYGTEVTVWIEPGKHIASRSCESSDPRCAGRSPNRKVVQQLFDNALNEVLVMNESGFGRYEVEQCGEIEGPRAWLKLVTSAMLDFDSRFVYKIGKRTSPSLMNYALKYFAKKKEPYGYAQFGTPPPHQRSAGIDYLCGPALKSLRIVTQLDVQPLTSNKTSGSAKGM